MPGRSPRPRRRTCSHGDVTGAGRSKRGGPYVESDRSGGRRLGSQSGAEPPSDGHDYDAEGNEPTTVRQPQDDDDRECRLRDLVTEAGFAGTFSALAGLARRWAEYPEVDARAAAELRLLGRRLDVLARDVAASTCLR